MSLLPGNYQFVKNENYAEYLKSLGPDVSNEIATKLNSATPSIEVTVDGNNCNITNSSGQGQKFVFGQVFDEELFPGINVKTTANLTGNKIEVQSTFADGRSGSRVFEFTAEGLTIHYANPKCNAKRVFKRA